MNLGLDTERVDRKVYASTVEHFRKAEIRLPTFAELADPSRVPEPVTEALASVGRDEAHPANLFRVHWNNSNIGAGPNERLEVPDHLVLPRALTGVEAPIVVLPADRFPMIHAHKVLATYGCLAPRLITGRFDPRRNKAVWPSTGNYCRGGVAISKIMGCRGVAVLPAGMSRERFDWLNEWVTDPTDIIRTPGTESNVKEIYDRCAELARDPENVIFNQFSEFGNYLAHYQLTGRALASVFASLRSAEPALELAAFVSATGSAGTLAAGDFLKDEYGSRIVAVEALECPTLLYNGFGEHNIQGIGDKHVPLIHNVMNTDIVTAVSDRSTDRLFVLFNTDTGRDYLTQRLEVPEAIVDQLGRFGFSSICNMLAAIKTAKQLELGSRDVLMTVATDGAELYTSELDKILERDFPGGFSPARAVETAEQHLVNVTTEHHLELSAMDRERIFNLGYFTWVEQQGITLGDFIARKEQAFWRGLRDFLPAWDDQIREFNRKTGTDA
ncbi:MAG: pyridoxal-5'-phosphate-dependent protein subunit beta [Acidobacteriota bacterium]|nr:pyridoxal-5'-phosphate-dependent protein subunit beta [Acidobacteriota bacterium]